MGNAKVDYKSEYTGTSVMIAAINETFSLEKTVETIRATCTPLDVAEMLILLSRTKSTPECIATAERIVAAGDSLPARIVWQVLPFAGGAYRAGIDAAVGSHVLMMSADLETDPVYVKTMIEQSKANPEAIVTMSRWIRGGKFIGYSKVKYICNAIFQKMLSAVFFTRLSDLTYGFRNFPADLLRKIDWRELRHPFFLETAIVPLRLGVRFIEQPSVWAARQEAESQNFFMANFKYFKTAFRVRFTPWKKLLKSYGSQIDAGKVG